MRRFAGNQKYIFKINRIKTYALIAFSLFLTICGSTKLVSFLNERNSNLDANATSGAGDQINPAYTESQRLKVLVVEINPHLNTVDGQPKAGDYIYEGEYYYSSDVSNENEVVLDEGRGISGLFVNEQINDIEFASHGYMNIDIVGWDYVDDFPHYKTSFTLPNGQSAYSFDEANYLLAAGNVGGYAGWNNLRSGCWLYGTSNCGLTTTNGVQAVNPPAKESFDMDWIMSELDLIERRNHDEFDQVWLISIDPLNNYSATMVGDWDLVSTSGDFPYAADCDRFVIFSLTMSSGTFAVGSNLQNVSSSIGHILGNAYKNTSQNFSSANQANVSTQDEYLELNDWDRFILNKRNNAGTLYGIGEYYVPFNVAYSGDVSSSEFVNTTYKEWEEKRLDEMIGEYTSENDSIWKSSEPYNDDGANGVRNENRYWQRFWLSMLPHDSGYTERGYLKNWWKYAYSLDYVTNITTTNANINLRVGENLTLGYTATYWSGVDRNETVERMDNNVKIADNSIVDWRDGAFRALGVGSTTVTLYRDGRQLTYTVNVEEGQNDPITSTINTDVFPVGSGTVNITGGATNDNSYENGTQLTLEAVPSDSNIWQFSKWREDNDTTNPRNIEVNTDATYTAIFTKRQYSVTVRTADNTITMGKVSINNGNASNSVTEQFEYNAEVRINAVPNDGYEFISWSNGNTNPIITMPVTKDETLIATFRQKDDESPDPIVAPAVYTIAIGASPAEGGVVTGVVVDGVGQFTNNGDYEEGTRIRLAATPNDNYQFVNWNNDENLNDAELEITVTKDETYIAYFARIENDPGEGENDPGEGEDDPGEGEDGGGDLLIPNTSVGVSVPDTGASMGDSNGVLGVATLVPIFMASLTVLWFAFGHCCKHVKFD